MNIPASRPAATAAADAAFEEFVRGRSAYFFRLALVLTAWNRAAAEDVLQIALERTFRHRRTLFRADSARRREQPLDAAAGVTARDQAGLVADRDALVRALAALPPKQRAVLVLRYWEDLPDPVIAAALNCSQATVRSQASRALARLRELDDGTLAGTPLADLPPAGAPHGGKRHD